MSQRVEQSAVQSAILSVTHCLTGRFDFQEALLADPGGTSATAPQHVDLLLGDVQLGLLSSTQLCVFIVSLVRFRNQSNKGSQISSPHAEHRLAPRVVLPVRSGAHQVPHDDGYGDVALVEGRADGAFG